MKMADEGSGNRYHRRSAVQTFHHARELRGNQTDAERMLWQGLRLHQMGDLRFRRQHAIGHYIVDFCCLKPKLIIEVDGGHHQQQKEYDDERTAFLATKGFRVMRFWNHEVLNDLDAVLQEILRVVEEMKQGS
jgi:very-short-patch-repair endonuclease